MTWWRGDEVYEINAEFTEMCLVIYLSRSLDSSVYDCRQLLRAFFHCAVSAADEATSWSSQWHTSGNTDVVKLTVTHQVQHRRRGVRSTSCRRWREWPTAAERKSKRPVMSPTRLCRRPGWSDKVCWVRSGSVQTSLDGPGQTLSLVGSGLKVYKMIKNDIS